MKYLYYPGCSLEGTALEYNLSTRALMSAVGADLVEIDDWTCCGASAAEATNYYLSLALPARNLALAESMDAAEDILVPCSACYLNLKKIEEKIRKDAALLEKINEILQENQLRLTGQVHVRHLLDVIVNDVGPEKIQAGVKKPLEDLSIAPYYGCQALRPYVIFDDPEDPHSMDALIEATGAAIYPWKMSTKCCGASHMNTEAEVGLELVAAILKGAKGADAIVTVCPMCQMNLEAYQRKISRMLKEDLSTTIVYLPQLLGMAMDLAPGDLRLDLNLAVSKKIFDRLHSDRRVAAVVP
ncbi:MAG: CoB--CoM heterodisulfide reductase iron-sulfur subunit B family protein [Desulfobacterales bacterium]|jgi:heterodisulfide reductase subunit B